METRNGRKGEKPSLNVRVVYAFNALNLKNKPKHLNNYDIELTTLYTKPIMVWIQATWLNSSLLHYFYQ